MSAALTLGALAAGPPSGTAGSPSPRPTMWLGTSWKMTKTLAEARAWVDEVSSAAAPAGVRRFVLPALTALAAVAERRPAGSPLLVGAQNAHWAAEGALTGEVSMGMVRDAGADLVEVGHSERRALLGDTDQVVAAKVAAALRHGLTPLLCIGEPEPVRHAGHAEAFVADQVRAALAQVGAADVSRVLVAYEPVWAIGEDGRAADPDELHGVLAAVRASVADVFPGQGPRALLYGGSVTPANAAALLRLDTLDGLFVGRAAWTAAGFLALTHICATAARERAAAVPLPARPVPPPGEQRSL